MDRMFPVVYQQSLYDCGLACIKSLAHYYDKGYPNSASRDLEDIMATRCGISIADIRQELDAIGLESLPLECSIEDIISHSLLPGIALLKSNHYVINLKLIQCCMSIRRPYAWMCASRTRCVCKRLVSR